MVAPAACAAACGACRECALYAFCLEGCAGGPHTDACRQRQRKLKNAAAGKTPGGAAIHVAAQDGDAEALAACLLEGTAVDARNRRQHTPLMLAAEHGHPKLVAQLLAAGADASLTNTKRLNSRELASRHVQQKGRKQRDSDAEIAALLLEAEQRAAAASAADRAAAPPQIRCPVCGEAIRNRQRVDYLSEDGQSRYVSDFLRSDGLRTMRTHPDHHYHSLLETRQLRKEVSESWAVISEVRELLGELDLDPRNVVLFDLCSGKGLTAVCMALEWPETKVVAVDIISDKCLPHTTDLSNLRYAEADLFKAGPMLQSEMAAGLAGLGQEPSAKELVGVLVGSHLCGRLSVQAVELFRTLPVVAGLVLSPCCWPRRRDYNRTDAELAELAGLMWLKASQSDTYTTWGQHLWRLLAAPGPGERRHNGGDGGEAAGGGASDIGKQALSNRYVQQAIGFDGHSGKPEPESEPEPEPEPMPYPEHEPPKAAHVDAISIGICRDTQVLSEKNIVLTAVKKQTIKTLRPAVWPMGEEGKVSAGSTAVVVDLEAHRQHALGAQRRYVRSAGAGLWWRHAALRETYGMGLPAAE